MNTRETYKPGKTLDAKVTKATARWTLVMTRDLRHPPALVWEAMTDPAQLAHWAPFEADRNLGTTGPVKLGMPGSPQAASECVVKRAEAPKVLEYTFGGNEVRWELDPYDGGTRLTLWTIIPPKFIAWGAAGWHICLDVLDHLLAKDPIGRIVGPEAMKFDWQRLNTEYAAQLGVETQPFPGGKS